MKGNLHLGRVSGIKIQVHWTFFFIIAWIVFIDLRRGGNLQSSLISIAFVMAIFACVVLHELGHALTAKKFNIKTRRITLLPIGGVAMLEKMPEKPSEELAVAIAGPLVNVVIAAILLLFVPLGDYFAMNAEQLEELMSSISLTNFLLNLFVANIVLVIFNMIPAFPMDGGRVLRALLSMKMSRSEATNIAANLGQLLSLGFFILGIMYNPFLILIALFIFLGAAGENKMEQQLSLIKDYQVSDAMLTNLTFLTPQTRVKDVVELLIAGVERDFLVTDTNHTLIGILHYDDLLKNVKNQEMAIEGILDTEYKILEASAPLRDALETINREKRKFIPVFENGKLKGAIDLTNLSEFILLRANLLPQVN